jgi:hypothetical protein
MAKKKSSKKGKKGTKSSKGTTMMMSKSKMGKGC